MVSLQLYSVSHVSHKDLLRFKEEGKWQRSGGACGMRTTFGKYDLPQVMPVQVIGIQNQVTAGELSRHPIKLSSLGWDLVAELQLLKEATDRSKGWLGVD